MLSCWEQMKTVQAELSDKQLEVTALQKDLEIQDPTRNRGAEFAW